MIQNMRLPLFLRVFYYFRLVYVRFDAVSHRSVEGHKIVYIIGVKFSWTLVLK